MTSSFDEFSASASGDIARDLAELRVFLTTNVLREFESFYGLGSKHRSYLDSTIDRWFDDSTNYDGRWSLFDSRLPKVGKVLDMSSGCGTFVIHGLRNGRDVWGIEPEDWKREYFQRKLALLGMPPETSTRVSKSFGEQLPFGDETFDVATSYQTIEHVTNVAACVDELLRVVKCGGVVHLSAPDYNSFFEPHYRVPFLPTMNKSLAGAYLSLLGRPRKGLQYLNWVTERSVMALLDRSPHKNHCERLSQAGEGAIRDKILNRLPVPLRIETIVQAVRAAQKIRQSTKRLFQFGPLDGSIDLWIVKG
ncbi:MAG TPA: class I SAM-dependent methyltransferase [Polyangia bacterium]|nr:class I SAM-dependent methyltransferase [Polyangia bacterium]